MKRYSLAAVTALLALMPWHGTVRATPPSYSVENLGNFGGLVPSVSGVNASGQVVGNVAGEAGSQAVRYTNGVWEALPGLPSSAFSVAAGINAAGDVVGYHVTATGDLRAFRYRDGQPLDDIAPLVGGSFTEGFAINAAGTVVGFGDSPRGIVGFRADPGLPAVELPSLNGGFAQACGINAAGQIAGSSVNPAGVTHATRIDPGQLSPVEILPLDGQAGTSQVCAIDADGTVGGQGNNGGVAHAFRFSTAGGGLDLDNFGASVGSNVEAIAGGLSVGWFQLADDSTRAFAHRDGDGSFDLNTRIDDPSWVLSLARGVNADGVIVGDGVLNGAPAAFRLTPVALDSTPPVISSVSANPYSISPADGRVVPVAITVVATDNVDASPACKVTGVTGGAAGDSSVTGPLSVQVRAVGNAAYTVNVRCTDAAGNYSNGATGVSVVAPPPPPHDTKPPVIRFLFAQRSETKLNGVKWESVKLFVWATDNVDHSPFCSITSITGAPAGSYAITGRLTARLRENRSLGDLDRVYVLHVSCVDNDGNVAKATVSIDPNGRTTYSGDHRRWRW
jgi:probable HAF family extracellular repeat protein